VDNHNENGPETVNSQAQFYLDDILTNPRTSVIREDSGAIRCYSPDGRGAHFDSTQQFKGFLEYEEQDVKDHRLDISSNLDYEGMVVDIMHLDNLLIRLSADEGIEKPKIEIFDKAKEDAVWEIDYQDFLRILEKGFKKLKEVNAFE
jgi:hypothetical protein